MYLHGEEMEMRAEIDCIWIGRPFVARNVGADQKRIGNRSVSGNTRKSGSSDNYNRKRTKRKAETSQQILLFLT